MHLAAATNEVDELIRFRFNARSKLSPATYNASDRRGSLPETRGSYMLFELAAWDLPHGPINMTLLARCVSVQL